MKAIILNAGTNGNLQEILGDKPKGMLEISDTNLLSMQIDTLYKCGIEDIVVVRGFGKKYINIPGIVYYDNLEYENTGVLYSLFCAENEFNDDLIVLYGDVLFDEDVLKKLLSSKADLTVGAILNYKEVLGNVDYKAKEMLTFDSENYIRTIGKNLTFDSDNVGFFSGIMKVSKFGTEILKNHFKRISEVENCNYFYSKKDLKSIWLTDFLNEICQLGVAMQCTIFEKGWYELDTKEDYINVCNDVNFMAKFLSVKTDWNERSKTYNNIQWVNQGSTLECMVDAAKDVNPKRILDLGTGTGKVLNAMHEAYPEAKCYGLDISSGMMAKIKQQGYSLLVGNIENLSRFEDGFFDVVTARMVLHHSSDLVAVFREVNRVLRKGGKFIICEGNPPSKECLDFYEKMFRYKETRHTFLVDDLINYCINSDFENIQAKVVTMKNMSLNNWLNNAGVPFRNIDIIRKLHYEADQKVKQAYAMKEFNDDILMTWKFSIIIGQKA